MRKNRKLIQKIKKKLMILKKILVQKIKKKMMIKIKKLQKNMNFLKLNFKN